jgi:Zn-dependent protease with chaperone function
MNLTRRPRALIASLALLATGLAGAQSFVTDTRLLAAPDAAARAVSEARSGAAARVLKRQGFWLEVESGSTRGWVRISALKLATFTAPLAMDTGRLGTNNIVATSAARSLSAKDLIEGRSDDQAVERLFAFRPDPTQLVQFAQAGALAEVRFTALGPAAVAPASTEAGTAGASEDFIGRLWVARIMGVAPLHTSQELQRYVNLLGGRLASQVEGSRTWRFGVLDTDAVNAFAAPGGVVLVTSGFVRQLSSEDELAAVLAHEIAHVARAHHYQVMLRARQSEAVVRGLRPDPGLSRASAQFYTRGLEPASEHEADVMGVQLLARMGHDPSAFLSVLEKLDALGSSEPRVALLASTHPPARERMDYLARAGIERLPIPSASPQARDARFAQVVRAALRP